MAVHLPRTEYVDALPDWNRIRLAIAGRSAILKEDIGAFLPMTESQRDPKNADMYKIYTERATWYGASARTLDAWVGTLTRKPMTVEVPSPYKPRLKNIDGQGNTIDSLARQLVREVCAYGRAACMVDVGNAASAGNPNTLPYIALYNAFSIISWRPRATVEGNVLDQVILKEELSEPHPSGFGVIKRPLYRVLELDENGWYRCRLFTMREGVPLEYGKPIYPTRGGTGGYLDYIPFVFVTPTGTGFEIEKSPLQDVVDANISHFQTSADRDFALYWSASPTVIVTGLSDDETGKLTVGSGNYIRLPVGATAAYLEFSGHGMAAIQEALHDKQQLLASLGVSMLNAPKREAETFEALALKSSGETASLSTIADAVSKAITTCLKYATHWRFLDGEVRAELPRDLVNIKLPAEEHKVLMIAVQSGLMSEDDYYWNLEQGGRLRPNVTAEQAKNDARNDKPILLSDYRTPPTAKQREVPAKTTGKTDDETDETNEADEADVKTKVNRRRRR